MDFMLKTEINDAVIGQQQFSTNEDGLLQKLKDFFDSSELMLADELYGQMLQHATESKHWYNVTVETTVHNKIFFGDYLNQKGFHGICFIDYPIVIDSTNTESEYRKAVLCKIRFDYFNFIMDKCKKFFAVDHI